MRCLTLLSIVTFVSAQYQYGSPSYTAPPLSASYAGAPVPGSAAQGAEYNKEFYSYVAPAEDNAYDSQGLLGAVKKNLKVIFIRGPEDNGLENAAVNLAGVAGADRTAIYVLNKQTDLANLAQQIQNAQSKNHQKPEVHFVRYRTDADAQYAQHTIHSQYDALPGHSTDHNNDAASVLNYASPSLSLPPAGPVSNDLSVGEQHSSAHAYTAGAGYTYAAGH